MNTLSNAITNHSFFHGMKPEHLAVLVKCASEKEFKRDEVLFREGEPANQFYLIESGSIALEAHEPANGTVLVQTLGPGDLLGWSWLFPPFTWHFQARALEATTAIGLSGAPPLVMAEKNPAFGYQLMKCVAQMVIHRLQAARKQLLQQQVESAFDG